MNLSIDIHSESGYLACTITGEWATDELKAFLETLSNELKKRGCSRIFADMSQVSGPPQEMDRFYLGKYVAFGLHNIKIAIVYKKVLKNKFFEDTAANRGAWIMVFPDKPKALQWLLT